MSEFKLLPPDSVISRDPLMPFMTGNVCKGESYIDIAHERLLLINEETLKTWVVDGADCEVLMVGSAWKKGKVRIKIAIEFCEEE